MRLADWLLCLLAAAVSCCRDTAADSGQSSQAPDAGAHRRTVGIDYGASHVRVAVFQDGKVEILRNDQGRELTPTYVAFTESGHRLIGDEAKSQLTANPANTVFSVLPLMGRTFHDKVVQDHMKRIPYTVYDRSDMPAIEVQKGDRTESFTPEEIVAMQLRMMKETAERHLNETVSGAVISVSSCFSYVQSRSMRDAAKIAGLNEVFILSAPVAAAVAQYNLNSRNNLNADTQRDQRILALDFGSGSVGAAVLSITGGAVGMEAQGSLCNAGGEMFEQRVTDHVMKLLEKKKGRAMVGKLRQSDPAMMKLRKEVERATRLLSYEEQARIDVDLFDNEDFSEVLTRPRFTELNADLLLGTLRLAKDALQEAGRRADELQEVILVGGASRTPAIRQLVAKLGGQPKWSDLLDPDTASVTGAAVHGGFLDGRQGSGRQMAVLTLCPRTVGYRTADDGYEPMIGRNEVLPSKNSRAVHVSSSSGADNQVSSIDVQVYEGEGPKAINNILVGTVRLELKPTSSPDVWIAFRMAQYYLLEVSALEMKTGAEVTVEFEHGLGAFRMQSMRRRLRALAQSDRREVTRLAARDDLESLAYQCLRLMRSNSSSSQDCATAETAAQAAIEWLEANAQADAGQLATRRAELALALRCSAIQQRL